MFARITGIQVLDHETRHRMLRRITDVPGTSFRELQDYVHLADGPTTWHLEKLSRGGFVSLVRAGKTRRYFPRDFPSKLAKAIVSLQVESRRALLREVATSDGISQAELALRTGLAAPTALHHLEILESLGLVASWRTGRLRCYRATSEGRTVLGRPIAG